MLAIDLFCGLGGWSEGFLAEGWEVIGFDIERHVYGDQRYPAQLVLQDVLTLHGSQFRNVDAIVASPPCQKYSYLAMPWSRSSDPNNSKAAKALRAKWETEGPDNRLFDACFRIQREACEAAGRHIPLIVENVRGTQPWVGRAAWNYGSFYLWGDVPALMPFSGRIRKSQHTPLTVTPQGTGSTSWFFGNSKHEGRFYGQKIETYSDPRRNGGRGSHLTNPAENLRRLEEGRKGFTTRFEDMTMAWHSSKSPSRKAASAQIAKIPFELSSYIARVFRPQERAA